MRPSSFSPKRRASNERTEPTFSCSPSMADGDDVLQHDIQAALHFSITTIGTEHAEQARLCPAAGAQQRCKSFEV